MLERFKLNPGVKNWAWTFMALASWTYVSIAHYHHNEFTKIAAFTLIITMIGHIAYGVVKLLLWLLETLIVMDMKNKLDN